MQTLLVCVALIVLPLLLDHPCAAAAAAPAPRPLSIDRLSGAQDFALLNATEPRERHQVPRLNAVCPSGDNSMEAPCWSRASPRADPLPLCGFTIQARQTLLLALAPPT